jgi:hypothetical protein
LLFTEEEGVSHQAALVEAITTAVVLTAGIHLVDTIMEEEATAATLQAEDIIMEGVHHRVEEVITMVEVIMKRLQLLEMEIIMVAEVGIRLAMATATTKETAIIMVVDMVIMVEMETIMGAIIIAMKTVMIAMAGILLLL